MSVSTDRRIGVTASAAVKVPCRVATTANITLSGEQTIDGVAVVILDRVLVKDQTDATENGIYVADTSTWKRAPDFDGSGDVKTGTLIPVNSGTLNGDEMFRVSTVGAIIPGTTSITFEHAWVGDVDQLRTDLAAVAGGGKLVAFKRDVTGGTSRTVESKLLERISVFDFMTSAEIADVQAETLLIDVTAAVQAALDYACTFISGVRLRFPRGRYKITSPLNASISGFGENIILEGDGRTSTRLVGALTSSGPVLDLTGWQRPVVRDLRITVDQASYSATCCILIAQNNSGHHNRYPVLNHITAELYNTAGKAAIVVFNADLALLNDVEAYAGINNSGDALAIGAKILAGVTSPFQTLTAAGDGTIYQLNNSSFIGPCGVRFTGGLALTFNNTYVAVINPIGPDKASIVFDHAWQSNGAVLRGENLRTENQCSPIADPCNSIYCKGAMYTISIRGDLNDDDGTPVGGAFFKLDQGCGTLEFVGFTANGLHDLLNVTGNIDVLRGSMNIAQFGSVSGEIAQYDFHSTLNYDFLSTLVSKVTRQGITKGIPILPRSVYVRDVNQPQPAASGYNALSNKTTTGYTGGSGMQTRHSFKIPAGMLTGEGQVVRTLSFELAGVAPADCSMKMQLRQGATTVDLGTDTVTVSLYYIFAKVILANTLTADGLYAHKAVWNSTTIRSNLMSTGGYSTIDTETDFYLDVQVQSASNDPIDLSICNAVLH